MTCTPSIDMRCMPAPVAHTAEAGNPLLRLISGQCGSHPSVHHLRKTDTLQLASTEPSVHLVGAGLMSGQVAHTRRPTTSSSPSNTTSSSSRPAHSDHDGLRPHHARSHIRVLCATSAAPSRRQSNACKIILFVLTPPRHPKCCPAVARSCSIWCRILQRHWQAHCKAKACAPAIGCIRACAPPCNAAHERLNVPTGQSSKTDPTALQAISGNTAKLDYLDNPPDPLTLCAATNGVDIRRHLARSAGTEIDRTSQRRQRYEKHLCFGHPSRFCDAQ